MSLKVISSNIRFANPQDGKHDWPHRKDFLAETLLEYGPDIIGTQEGREPQLKELDMALNGFQLAQEHREWIEERMYPCLWYHLDKLDCHRSGDIWLSETPHLPGSKSFDSAFPRLCTWAIFNHIKLNKLFMTVNTHLDHVLAESRIEQARVLCEEIKKINTDNLPIVLMGDFNESPEGGVRKIINQLLPELYDPWSQEETGSHHGFGKRMEDTSRIDWILADNKISSHEIFLEKKQKNGLYPSDHYPLKATLIF